MNIRSIFSALSGLALWLFLLFCCLPCAMAQDWGLGYGIGGGTADTVGILGRGVNQAVVGSSLSNASYYVVSGKPAGVPRIQFLDVSTDLASGGVNIYVVTNTYTITNAVGATGTNCFQISTTNGLANTDLLLLQNLASDSYQLLVNSNNSSFFLVTMSTSTNACAVGDKIHKLARIGNIGLYGTAGQTARTNIYALNLVAGREGSPLVLIATGSNAVTLNSVSGEFYKRPRF